MSKLSTELMVLNHNLIDENTKFIKVMNDLNYRIQILETQSEENNVAIKNLIKTNQNLNKYIDHLECKLGGE